MEDYYHYSKRDKKFKNLLTLIDNNLGFSVFQSIEKTKVELSELQKSQFSYSKMDIEINEEISIAEYEAIIEKDIKKINIYLDEFMLNNNIKPADIDSLFLTGGTSLVTAVQNLFSTKFPHVTLNSGDNFTSVARGLALSGYLFENE
jgi:hypothetical chaperone protein